MNELASRAAGHQTGGCKGASGTALKKSVARPIQIHDPHCGNAPNLRQTAVVAGLQVPFMAVKILSEGSSERGLAPIWFYQKTRATRHAKPLKYLILHNLFLEYGNRTRPQTQSFSANVLSEFN